jgi:hypothetical protein
MKIIQLQIDDKNYDSFMAIIQNLKKGFVKNFTVQSRCEIETVSNKEQDDYESILNSMSKDDKTVSSKDSIQI